jgi:hypothetical protein
MSDIVQALRAMGFSAPNGAAETGQLCGGVSGHEGICVPSDCSVKLVQMQRDDKVWAVALA